MEIVYNESELRTYMESAVKASKAHPILVDKYLSHAIEIDVDVVSDGTDIFIGGILEHIEEAGVHSGDATMSLPPQTISPEIIAKIEEIAIKVAKALNIIGLLNLQLAVKNGEVYMIEANPRASRTVPLVSKAIGVPLAKITTKVMLGRTLKELGYVGSADHKKRSSQIFCFPLLETAGCRLNSRSRNEIHR